MTGQTDRLKGLLLMTAAGLCWSSGGILVRSVSITSAWEIVFWRASFMALFVGIFLIVRYGSRTLSYVTAVGFPGVWAGAFLALSFFLFISSVVRTTVANALFLSSITPLVAALLGWFFLNEHVSRRTTIAMMASLGGIALMFADAFGSPGSLIGNLLACGVPLAFGANIIILRKMGASVDMVPTILLGGLIAMPIALLMGWPLTASWHDVGILAVMGTFQLGMGCVLMTLAAPHLTAVEIGLLALLETILGPLWVWLGVGERPSDTALLGGLVVLTSLVVNQLAGLRSARLVAAPASQ
ncbi:MAG: DMT family transporter [Deltaproteobacteria bacterium]|nr:DMT family transporter [Deltaproteobacteria bacterium]